LVEIFTASAKAFVSSVSLEPDSSSSLSVSVVVLDRACE
jgi:hypothetical protein